MKSTITFRRDRKNVKKMIHLKNGVFLIYAPRQLQTCPIQYKRYGTDINVISPKNSHGYFT